MQTYDYSSILKQLPSFAQDFINHLSVINRSETTRRSYVYELRHFFNYILGTPKFEALPSISSFTLENMASLNHRDVEAFLSWAKTEGNNGPRALSRKQAAIKSLYRYLVREEMLIKDITLKLEPIAVKSKLPKALEPNEVADLTEVLEDGQGLTKGQLKYYNYTEKRDRAIILTLINTGLRLSELCGLNLSDINYKDSSFSVLGKGDKDAKVYFNDEVSAILQDYIKNERSRYNKSYTDALFLSIQCKRISKTSVESIVKKYMKILADMGYNTSDFSTHKMRSTTATMLLRETDNLALVQDFLRHSDPRTTRQYAKILDEQLKRAANMIKFK